MTINTEETVGTEEALAQRKRFIAFHPFEVWEFEGTSEERFEGRFSSLECAVSTAMHIKGGIKSSTHIKNGVQVQAKHLDYAAVRREWSEMKKRRLSSQPYGETVH